MIENICKTNNVNIISEEDYSLVPIPSIYNGSGGFYKKFTPFSEIWYDNMKKIKKQTIPKVSLDGLINKSINNEHKIKISDKYGKYV